ncbi:hypothetical protein BHE74_00048516, partial [Ensete ventricosum]
RQKQGWVEQKAAAVWSTLEQRGNDSGNRVVRLRQGLEMVAPCRGRRGVGAGDNDSDAAREPDVGNLAMATGGKWGHGSSDRGGGKARKRQRRKMATLGQRWQRRIREEDENDNRYGRQVAAQQVTGNEEGSDDKRVEQQLRRDNNDRHGRVAGGSQWRRVERQ